MEQQLDVKFVLRTTIYIWEDVFQHAQKNIIMILLQRNVFSVIVLVKLAMDNSTQIA